MVWLFVFTTVYVSPHLTPDDFWSGWELDPLVIVGMSVASLLYAFGVVRVWRRAGIGHGVTRAQCIAFVLGVVVLFIALISPLAALGEELFSAHMA